MTDYIQIIDTPRTSAVRKLRKPPKSSAVSRLKGSKVTTKKANQLWRESPFEPGSSLVACDDHEQVRQWLVDRQEKFKAKVRKGLDQLKVSDETRHLASTLFTNPTATSVFTLNDDNLFLHAFDLAVTELLPRIAADPEVEVALVTFITGDGGSSLHRPDIELDTSQESVRRTLSAMAPNWLARTELGFFNNITFKGNGQEGGRHLQRHEHALIWGPQVHRRAEEVAERREHKFEKNVTDAERVRVVRAYDNTDANLTRLLGYLFKAPAYAMTWYPGKDGKKGNIHHSEESDRYLNYYRLAVLQSMLQFEQTFFGCKEGNSILGKLKRSARDLAWLTASKDLLMHPGEIGPFWAEVIREAGIETDRLPVIRLRQPK